MVGEGRTLWLWNTLPKSGIKAEDQTWKKEGDSVENVHRLKLGQSNIADENVLHTYYFWLIFQLSLADSRFVVAPSNKLVQVSSFFACWQFLVICFFGILLILSFQLTMVRAALIVLARVSNHPTLSSTT